MTLETPTSPLAMLQSIGIITADQHQRALAAAEAAEANVLSDLSDLLVWLYGRDIVSSADLRRAWAHVSANYSGEEQEHYTAILKKTVDTIKHAKRSISEASVRMLQDMALITPGEHDQLLPQLNSDLYISRPAVALAWIELNGKLTRDRVQEIRRAMTQGGPELTNLLREVDGLKQEHKTAVRAAWRRTLTGPVGMLLGAVLLVAGTYIWRIVEPPPPPGCADPEITRSLKKMMLRASFDAVIAMPSAAGTPMPDLVASKEVGYASEKHVRGCLGTLQSGDTELPYAYTIERDRIDGETRVIGASTAIVKARFSHLDANGRFIHNATPIGRDDAENAFRAGFDKQVGGPKSPASEDRSGKLPQFAPPAAQRTRPIAEIEPVAPCREIKAGLVYSCRLLVEYNDPLMLMLKHSSMDLEGDFTFQRDTDSSPWTMSDTFGAEFADILAKSSLEAVRQ